MGREEEQEQEQGGNTPRDAASTCRGLGYMQVTLYTRMYVKLFASTSFHLTILLRMWRKHLGFTCFKNEALRGLAAFYIYKVSK